LLEQALQVALTAPAKAVGLLRHFSAVSLSDGTQLNLPQTLAALWPASGGNASKAGIKCLFSWELLSGQLTLELGPGKQADNTFAAQRRPLPKGALRLADLGFFDLEVLGDYDRQGAYF